jgi:hypothetical protein
MKRLLCLGCVCSYIAWGGWVFENIPTTIDGFYPVPVGTELSAAYRAVHNSSGTKISEDIAVAYRSLKLRLSIKSATGWKHMTFADSGRFPSIALDSQGKPHMTFFNSSTKKIYYAHTVQPGTGNCGPQTSWACEEVPGNLWGAPKGRSAIAVSGTTVHVIYEAPWSPPNSSIIIYYKKTMGAANWSFGPDEATAGYGVKELSLRVDGAGVPHVLLVDQEGSFWYTKKTTGWNGVGAVLGHAALAITAGADPRLCYRDYSSDQLIYARSNGDTAWTLTTIDYNIGGTGVCAIAVPPENGIQLAGYYSPRIAYFDGPGSSIKYATPPIAAIGGTAWSVQTVTSATGVKKLEIGLDKNGKPVLIYFDGTTWSLRLARMQ